MRKNGDLTDFEHCIVVGTRRAGDLLGLSHISISRVKKKWSKKGKISLGKNTLLILKVRGDLANCLKQIESRQ